MDETCYLCDHSHKVMAHASGWDGHGKYTRALCHGMCDTDCYTRYQRGMRRGTA